MPTSRGNIDPKWLEFLRGTFKRNTRPDICREKAPYRNVVAMIANTRHRPEISEQDKHRLEITADKMGVTRTEFWFEMIA